MSTSPVQGEGTSPRARVEWLCSIRHEALAQDSRTTSQLVSSEAQSEDTSDLMELPCVVFTASLLRS
jgi:hypothetical protein